MSKKTKTTENNASPAEKTETHAFTSLPMKWRDVCFRYALQLNYSHQEIMKMSFKIGKFDRTVHGIAETEKI